ncbi:Hypothetical protein SCF082_LOCUS40227, partial [Durusdinium trenchii]
MPRLMQLMSAFLAAGLPQPEPGESCKDDEFTVRVQHGLAGALLGDSFAWNHEQSDVFLSDLSEQEHSCHGLELLHALRFVSLEGFEFRRFSQSWRSWADFMHEAEPDRSWSPGSVEALSLLEQGAEPEAVAGHYVDLEAAARIPALLLLAEHADDNGLVMASQEMQRVTHENPKVLQFGDFVLRAALALLRSRKPCSSAERQATMISALRSAAQGASCEHFHGLLDEVLTEVQSRASVLSVTGELSGSLATLHSDKEVIGRLTASGDAPGDEVQSEKTSFAIPAILWFVLAYDSLTTALNASNLLGGATTGRAIFVALLFACRDGVESLPLQFEHLPLSFKPLWSAPVLRLCSKPGTCHQPGKARRLHGVAVDAVILPEFTCTSGRHCYRIFMRFNGSALLESSSPEAQPLDWDEEEDGPWRPPDLAATCLARYFQFATVSGRHAPFGLWPANAMC